MRILLDTDIGEDIDDALTLALILASKELELIGVSTVFGNAQARSRQARTILAAAGDRFAKIPVAIGCTRGISSLPLQGLIAEFANPAHLPDQDASALAEGALVPVDPWHGVDFLIDTVLHGDGDIVPVMIGAMTNVALAIVKEPKLIRKIPRLSIMAGEFRRPMAEWNIRCDPEAAAIIFTSGIPISLIPWHVCDVVRFEPQEMERLAGSDLPICRQLSAALKAWQDRHAPGGEPHLKPPPRLYDPMAVPMNYLC